MDSAAGFDSAKAGQFIPPGERQQESVDPIWQRETEISREKAETKGRIFICAAPVYGIIFMTKMRHIP